MIDGPGDSSCPHRCLLPLALLVLLGAAKPAPVLLPPSPPAAIDPGAALGFVDVAIAENRLDAARELVARAMLRADSSELRLRSAEVALAAGALAEAATGFLDLAGDPLVAVRAQQGLGIVRLRQRRLPEAITALDAATAADPGLVRAWIARGVAADKLRDFAVADTAYGKALAIDPRNTAALTNRGYSLILRGRFAEAEADLVAATTIAPKLATAQTDLRFARAMQGRYREAFTGSTRAQLATDLNTVGFAAMARGDLATAEAYFTRAMSVNPRFDRVAWANLRYLKGLRDPLGADTASDPDSEAFFAATPR